MDLRFLGGGGGGGGTAEPPLTSTVLIVFKSLLFVDKSLLEPILLNILYGFC